MRDFNAVIAAVLAMNGAQAWANMMPPPPPAVKVDMYSIDAKGMGPKLGHITITETLVGLMFTPDLKGLPPGERGFHVHEVGNCAPGLKDGAMTAGWSAGAHYDPAKTGKHVGPHKEGGHKGDLEVLKVGADGTAKTVAMSKSLKLNDVAGRALMIHAGGDNYSDQPEPLGGGGGRIACGVVPAL